MFRIHQLIFSFWKNFEKWKKSSEPLLSEEDERCEQHFIKTHQRASDSLYIIRLCFKTEPPERWLDIEHIGSSCKIVELLFSKLKRRL